MDQRLFNASCSGDIETLHQLLQEDPFILSSCSLVDSNPLIIAAKSNQQAFALQLLNQNRELASLLDKDGFRPLDIAAAYGNIELVCKILDLSGSEICMLRGKDGKTPIHYAAMNGRVEILDMLLSKNPACLGNVTSFGETACHLAVKSFQFEVFQRILSHWLERDDNMAESLVNLGDGDGNSVLHCAVLRKQLETVEMLLNWNNSTAGNNKLQINSRNKKGLTPSDIIEILAFESPTDVRIRQLLHRHGGSSSSEMITQNPEPEEDQSVEGSNLTRGEKPKTLSEVLELFTFKWGRDSPGAARNILLIVSAFVATVTFQARINPPSFITEPDKGNTPGVSSFVIIAFLLANSIALSSSASIIEYLTKRLPFQREVRASMYCMMFAYGVSLGYMMPKGPLNMLLLIVSLWMPWLMRLIPYVFKKICNIFQEE